MSTTVIKIEGVSKLYSLNKGRSPKNDTLYSVLTNGIKNVKRITQKDIKEDFWALKDVSFEIDQGDRVGVIGRNGAGKSTLLKILSRITPPTKGKIEYSGRLASLLEVGTGFHGDLTGRENIYLNGSILGMSKQEISSKFDEIVDFAEIEKFVDTPVKRYSSGMYVRLAFAVAAHLEPEILIVDEVLAVGDAAFQKKCLGKMEDVSSNGRTILFVSHQMESVQKLCNKGILLEKGKFVTGGNIDSVIQTYLSENTAYNSSFAIEIPDNCLELNGYAIQLVVEDEFGNPINDIPMGRFWQVRIGFKINKYTPHFIIAFGTTTMLGLPIQTSWSLPKDIESGDYEVIFKNNELSYSEGSYKIVIGLSTNGRSIQYLEEAGLIQISDVSDKNYDLRIVNTKSGLMLNQMNSSFIKLS